MFKKAMNTFLSYKPFTQFLILTVVCAIIFGVFMCASQNILDTLFPQDAVYSHFNVLATEVIQKKSTDFLENSDVLNYFTVAENSKESTITITFFGYHSEELELVVSTNYTLVALKRVNDGFLFVIAQIIGLILGCVMFGGFISIIIIIIFLIIKRLYGWWINKSPNNIWPKINFRKIEFKKIDFEKINFFKKIKFKKIVSFKRKAKYKHSKQNHEPQVEFIPEQEIDEDYVDFEDADYLDSNAENEDEDNSY